MEGLLVVGFQLTVVDGIVGAGVHGRWVVVVVEEVVVCCVGLIGTLVVVVLCQFPGVVLLWPGSDPQTQSQWS